MSVSPSDPNALQIPIDLPVLVTQAVDGMPLATNLGGGSTGLLKRTVSAGVATISNASAGTDYLSPASVGTTVQGYSAYLADLVTGADSAIEGDVPTINGDGEIVWEAGGGTGLPAAATKGTVAVYDGSAWTILAPGTDAQILEARASESTGLKWVNPPSGTLPSATTKGTLAVWDGDSWEVLAAGSDGQVLEARASEATGLKWVAATGGSTTLPLSPPVGLRIAVNGAHPDHQIDVSVRQAVLTDGSAPQAFSGTCTVDLAASGANGLDTGSEAANTLYYLWMIGKSDGTFAGLLSTSATSPTMPAGYTFKFLASWGVNNASSNLLPFHQAGQVLCYDSIMNQVVLASTLDANTHTLALNSALTYPVVGTALCRLVQCSVQIEGAGATANLVLWRGDTPVDTTGATFTPEAYVNTDAAEVSSCVEIGIDSSAQIKYRNYGSTDKTYDFRLSKCYLDWF